MEGEVPRKEDNLTPEPETPTPEKPKEENEGSEVALNQEGTQAPEVESQEFDYDKSKVEINNLFNTRRDKLLLTLPEIFGPATKGDDGFQRALHSAQEKKSHDKVEGVSLDRFEELALLLEEKRLDIKAQKEQALADLEEQRTQIRKTRIAEI